MVRNWGDIHPQCGGNASDWDLYCSVVLPEVILNTSEVRTTQKDTFALVGKALSLIKLISLIKFQKSGSNVNCLVGILTV